MINTSYIWGYYHTITNHTTYVRRGTTSTVYFICKSRTNKTGSISRDTRSSRRQMPKNIKVTKVNEIKQCMEGGLQEEPVEFRSVLLLITWYLALPASVWSTVDWLHIYIYYEILTYSWEYDEHPMHTGSMVCTVCWHSKCITCSLEMVNKNGHLSLWRHLIKTLKSIKWRTYISDENLFRLVSTCGHFMVVCLGFNDW